MMKEKQLILDYSKDKGKLKKIRKDLSNKGGSLFNSTLTYNNHVDLFLGEGYQKTISLSKGFEDAGLSADETTVLGGWCAARTKCLLEIEKGNLFNPIKGSVIPLTFKNLIDWIQTAISGDQIIDSVGIYNGDKYALISEQLLWSRKIARAFETGSNTILNNTEKNLILDAIKISENRRFLITKKYIEFVKGKRIDLVKFTDSEIWDDLVKARNVLLDQIGISLKDLVAPFIENRFNHDLKQDINAQNDLKNYIDEYSLVWTMYTGPYLQLLKKLGIISTQNAVIIEPWSHARSNEGQIKLNDTIIQTSSRNHYLGNKGINKNLGFIAISESSEYNFKSTRTSLTISKVPNIQNYKLYFDRLNADSSISNLDLSRNKSFVLASNYLPYGKAKDLLVQMIVISNEYKNRKLKIKNNNLNFLDNNSRNKEEVRSLRGIKSKEMQNISLRLNDILFAMFEEIFN